MAGIAVAKLAASLDSTLSEMERLNKLKKLDLSLKNKAINIITADSPETIQTLSVFLEHAELAYLADEKKPLSPIHIPLIFHALDESRIPGQEPDDLAVVDVLRTESGTVAAELWKSVHRYWCGSTAFQEKIVDLRVLVAPEDNTWISNPQVFPRVNLQGSPSFPGNIRIGRRLQTYDEQELTAMISGAGGEREFAELMAGDLEIVGGEVMANQCKHWRWLATATFISRVLMSVSSTSKLIEYLIGRGIFQIIRDQIPFIATEHALSDRALTICTLVAKHPHMSVHMHLALRQGYLHIPLTLLTLNPYAAVVSYSRLLLGPLLFASATRFKVVKALARTSAELGTLAITAAPALRGAGHTMEHFEILRLHRAGLYDDYRRRRREELRMCADPECCAIRAKETFERCAGCLSRYYCSKTCQANDWIKQHRDLCLILRTERTVTIALGHSPREGNFMRKLMDFDLDRLRERVWKMQSTFLIEKPGELFVTNYDFTSGLADVSVVDAASYMSGLSVSHWNDLKDRVRRTAGQVTIDGATIMWKVHPYPFPAEDTARYYVVVRGLNTGIYSSRRVLVWGLPVADTLTRRQRARLSPALDQRHLLAARRWVECGLAHQTEVHVIEEILDEPLSEPLSPDPEWSTLHTAGCRSAGTPPPSPDLRTRDEAFLTELNERLRILEWDQFR
ncbi:hypothetical protein GGX14DRAFT_403920 [Mycena pura]|uniref:MYND-type domain-containing protein n=1 Tax=Mycena pura TaxID=153505 RepID=A0AAD6UYU9_9AGAR|nr:hypothetical protein GGX14DRAFT_403920 [Mycena pura]